MKSGQAMGMSLELWSCGKAYELNDQEEIKIVMTSRRPDSGRLRVEGRSLLSALPSPSCWRAGPPPSEKMVEQKKEENDFPFAVAVGDVYEGPLDLLLDLIRKQDIDIYDIPIARITAQYLAYVEKIRELDVNVAADFIYMAAVLIHIKIEDAVAARPAGARRRNRKIRAHELVNRLLEHEKFKSAAQMLLQKQQIEDAVLSNPSLKEFMEAEGTEPEIAADVIDLVKTFQQVLERVRDAPP